jgi:hypothetical protein
MGLSVASSALISHSAWMHHRCCSTELGRRQNRRLHRTRRGAGNIWRRNLKMCIGTHDILVNRLQWSPGIDIPRRCLRRGISEHQPVSDRIRHRPSFSIDNSNRIKSSIRQISKEQHLRFLHFIHPSDVLASCLPRRKGPWLQTPNLTFDRSPPRIPPLVKKSISRRSRQFLLPLQRLFLHHRVRRT